MNFRTPAALILLPPASRTDCDSTSLVLANRLPAVSRTISRSDNTSIEDGYVWSASANKDGSVLLYAAPRANSYRKDTGQRDLLSEHVPLADWDQLKACGAIAQYAFCTSALIPVCGQLLNVYA
ncbi:MAG: hypothetical protein CXZ00_01270 [Acidobacteria bacterium]|nr:MAG: hypothetical protein CXZ00_01270 [Acidobacteriota bacterium]